MKTNNLDNKYCIYFAMRPETYLHSEEAKLGDVINFPLPNILNLCIRIIEDSLLDISKKFDENRQLHCEIEYYDVTSMERKEAKNYTDIAEYFIRIMKYYLNEVWSIKGVTDRLGSSEDFHCYIVNYNVRTFLSFFADTISNGGFKPLTSEFNEYIYTPTYTVYDYIEMIIRGRWIVHPGNTFIDGEGSNKAPIIFNVFDTSLWSNHQNIKIKHFMLYIRILQYFNLFYKDRVIRYKDIEENLSVFFEKDHIEIAIKELTFVRMIYSFSEGEENIASKKTWSEVEIHSNGVFKLSPCGKFYIEKLICEFEYLYQMSISSLMFSEYADQLKENDCWQTQKELSVLYFLDSIFMILRDNLESYNELALYKFKELFCQDSEFICRPYRRMLISFIDVMNSKVQRAEKAKSKNLTNLVTILEKAKVLQDESNIFFQNKFKYIEKVGAIL